MMITVVNSKAAAVAVAVVVVAVVQCSRRAAIVVQDDVSGPSGKYDHRVTVKDPSFVGDVDYSAERTSGLSYMFNAPDGAQFPRSSKKWVGGIGWCIDAAKSLNPPLHPPS